VPELIHDCGKRIRFPSGTDGRRGKCPHCGGLVEVPDGSGLAPLPKIELDPPPNWSEYVAYLEDKGPPPRPVVMPSKLMLQTEADEQWERRIDVRPSRFACPSCRVRINMEQVICTGCGVDFRTGYTVDKSARLNEKGLEYLTQIPWLDDARRRMDDGDDEEEDEGGGGGNVDAARAERLAARAKRMKKKRLGG
jgi:hypothetical protein